MGSWSLNVPKHVVQVSAETIERGDDCEGDADGDQSVFDRAVVAGLVEQKRREAVLLSVGCIGPFAKVVLSAEAQFKLLLSVETRDVKRRLSTHT
jgi:hypothetical protein